MRKIILALMLLGLLPVGVPAAEAIPLTLKLEQSTDLGATWTLVGLPIYQDGVVPGDSNGAAGALVVVGTGSFSGSVNTGTNAPQPGDLARLVLSSVSLKSTATTGAITLRVTLQNDNLNPGLVSGPAQVSSIFGGRLTAPAGSSISIQSWVVPSGGGASVPVFFNEGTNLAAPATTGPIGIFGNITDAKLFDLAAAGNFSLLTQATVYFSGAGGLATVNLDTKVNAVPEPMSILLIGSGVLGLATVARRRNKKRSEATS